MLRLLPAPIWSVLAFGALLFSSPAFAESPELPHPIYKNLRYLEDFSHPDPNKAPDIWDRFKFIPFADSSLGKSYLTFGGELRERFETYRNPNFGIRAPESNRYLLHRLLLNADVHITDYFRAFVQLGNLDRVGERGVTSTTDIDRRDLTQGFVDLRLPTPLGNAPTLRYGREELLFGFQRLVAVREGPNARRAFDGYRVSDSWAGASIDFVSARPVNNLPGNFDDETNRSQKLTGIYATLPVGPALKADLYWLDYQNDNARFRGLTGEERRTTLGTRLFGKYEGFDWNLEYSNQTGRFRSSDIRAHLAAGIVGYKFNSLPWTPRIAVSANYASGDDPHSGTIGTFNAMYPRLPYFAELSLLVPSNVKDVRPVLELNPVQNVLVVFGYDMLWRASTGDGLYGSGLTQYAGTAAAKVTGAKIGTEISADVRWQVDQHLQVGAIASEMLVGPAATEALGKNVTFLVGYMKYRF
jgi:hypothetical protein